MRFAVYGASTSGVEQNFSLAAWAVKALQGCCGDIQECNNIKVVVDLKNYEQADLVVSAQKLYVQHFGNSRVSQPGGRISRGIPRKRTKDDTETKFLKSRREATRVGIAAGTSGGGAMPADLPEMSAEQKKECTHQSEVLLKQFRTALSDGLLLPSEIPDDILEGIRHLDKAEEKATKTRTAKYKAIDRALAEKETTE